MSKTPALAFLLAIFSVVNLTAGYEVKQLPAKPASEYAAHQDFQGLVIGAYPCHTQLRAQELFDTDKLLEKALFPVLVIVENRNDFPVKIGESDIYLIDKTGSRNPPVHYLDVLLRINSKKPLNTLSGPKDLAVSKLVKKDMLLDFEHKSFGEKIIAPSDSDRGVVFFEIPAGGDLKGCQLFLPEILNVSNGEQLVFFEFELQ